MRLLFLVIFLGCMAYVALHITGCAPMNIFYMMYRTPQDSIGLYAIDPEFIKLSPDIKFTPDQLRRLRADRRAAVAGKNLMKK